LDRSLDSGACAARTAAEDARRPWLVFAALVIVLAALGLPVNDLFRFAILVAATVLAVTGAVSARPLRWLAALAAVAACAVLRLWLAPPAIEEGHNVFIVDRPGGALERGLPADVFRVMAADFDARYPRERRCDPAVFGCWRHEGFPERPFAFSTDAVYQRPSYSRQVAGIGFADPVWLRLGFVNDRRYNWSSTASDVVRDVRVRGLAALLGRSQLAMPWFVMYRLPAAHAGSDLCWRGKVLWEGADERFAAVTHASMQCRTVTPEDAGRRVFGVAIAEPLAMRLDPGMAIRLRQLAQPALALVAAAAVLGLLVRARPRRAALPFALIAVTLAVAFLTDPGFIGGVRPFDGGDDGLVYDGFARAMLQRLLAGDVAGALEGGEPVFYFTPGLRYLRALEHLVFGETYLGYLALMLLLPFLVFALFRRFLPLAWAVAIVVVFAAVPVGVVFGTSLVQYVKWAARGFADPAACTFFIAALVLLLGRVEGGRGALAGEDRFGRAAAAGLLFALALFVRPNIAPAAGVLLGGAGLAALWRRQARRVAGLCFGFAPVSAMALHNWYYGGVPLPFTSTAAHPGALVMPPAAWLAALAELARLDFTGGHAARALRHVGGWLAGPSESLLMAPLDLAAVLVVIAMALRRSVDPWLRLIAAAALAQHAVALFYATAGRYHYLAWLLTLLVVAAWTHDTGVPWFRDRFATLAMRIADNRAWLAFAHGLDRIARFHERA
jgi:hypothetical protein